MCQTFDYFAFSELGSINVKNHKKYNNVIKTTSDLDLMCNSYMNKMRGILHEAQ